MWQSPINLLGMDGYIAGLPVRDSFTLFQDQTLATPYNLTGKTGRFAVRSMGDTGTLLLEATTANAGLVFGGGAGTISLDSSLISPAHAEIPAGTHQYALEVFSAGGALEWIVSGQVEFRRRV